MSILPGRAGVQPTPPADFVTSPRPPVTVALLGNPNTGKSTLFNALTGLRQRVGNYPGVTVDTQVGHFRHAGRGFALIDLPGMYSLAPRSPDEILAVDILLGQRPDLRPDALVMIVDASNLERNLYLTSQVLEWGVPVVVALNMIDVAERQQLRIDAGRLSRELGVPVVPTQAHRGYGLKELKQAIAETAAGRRARAPAMDHRSEPVGNPPGGENDAVVAVVPAQPRVVFPEPFEREVAGLADRFGGQVPKCLVQRLLLDSGARLEQHLNRLAPLFRGDLQTAIREARERLDRAGCAAPLVEARARYAWIRQMLAGCLQRPAHTPVSWTDRLDRVLTHRIWGTLIFLVLMFLVFQSIFTWATPLMDLIKSGQASLAGALGSLLPAGAFASLLLDGVLQGVGSVLVFLPQIMILFGFIAILEDCGYMARAAFLMDKLMARAGLAGKSFIPLLSSVACAVPGIMATRVIENRRDRLATILVAPLMSCSARLPVYTILIAAFLSEDQAWWLPGLVLFGMYALGIVVAPVVALVLKRTLLRGETPVFVMEMPLYRWPSLRGVLRRMLDSGWVFVRRAGTLILACMIVVWALLYFPRGDDGTGQTYESRIFELEQQIQALEGDAGPGPADTLEAQRRQINEWRGAWKRQSVLGRVGRFIEPAVEPLGWDWRIGTAALASFPAREVVVGPSLRRGRRGTQ